MVTGYYLGRVVYLSGDPTYEGMQVHVWQWKDKKSRDANTFNTRSTFVARFRTTDDGGGQIQKPKVEVVSRSDIVMGLYDPSGQPLVKLDTSGAIPSKRLSNGSYVRDVIEAKVTEFKQQQRAQGRDGMFAQENFFVPGPTGKSLYDSYRGMFVTVNDVSVAVQPLDTLYAVKAKVAQKVSKDDDLSRMLFPELRAYANKISLRAALMDGKDEQELRTVIREKEMDQKRFMIKGKRVDGRSTLLQSGISDGSALR